MKGNYSSYPRLRLACLELERMLLLRNGRMLDRMNHVSDQSDQAGTVRTAVCGLDECAPCACLRQEKQGRLDLMTAAVTPVQTVLACGTHIFTCKI